jgi:hypothetical protein
VVCCCGSSELDAIAGRLAGDPHALDAVSTRPQAALVDLLIGQR